MHFAQYYLDCLSQASYLIGDQTTGRAVLVDPRRDIDAYLADAEAAGLRIELVIETHIHADFLSGHLEVARATGAEIAFGAAAETGFPIRRLRDGERICLGAAPASRPTRPRGPGPARRRERNPGRRRERNPASPSPSSPPPGTPWNPSAWSSVKTPTTRRRSAS
ncbi:MBL fold metallo-hydrolase [Streptomyces albulus]|nr:MBL fold metallo-hydrolase [Streptomyces noursei]